MFPLAPQPTGWGHRVVNAQCWEHLHLQKGSIAAIGQRQLSQAFCVDLSARVLAAARFLHVLQLPVDGIRQHVARAATELLLWPDDKTTHLFSKDLSGLAGMVAGWYGHQEVTIWLQNVQTTTEFHRDAQGGNFRPHEETRMLACYLGQGTFWVDEEKLTINQNQAGDIFVVGTGNEGVLHSPPHVGPDEPRLLAIIDPPNIGETVRNRPVWRP